MSYTDDRGWWVGSHSSFRVLIFEFSENSSRYSTYLGIFIFSFCVTCLLLVFLTFLYLDTDHLDRPLIINAQTTPSPWNDKMSQANFINTFCAQMWSFTGIITCDFFFLRYLNILGVCITVNGLKVFSSKHYLIQQPVFWGRNLSAWHFLTRQYFFFCKSTPDQSGPHMGTPFR